MKKVLILAYDFPPYVSVGGLRPYSWYKYFKEFGLYPIVVTRQWGNKYGNHLDYVAQSDSNETIIEETEYGTIIRTPYSPNLSNRILLKYGDNKFRFIRKLITAYYEFMQFVFFIGPKSGIYQGAQNYLSQNNVDVIIATGEPFVLFKYASKLSSIYDTPWIADFRDPWSQNKNRNRYKIIKLVYAYFEKRYLKKVSKILTVSAFLVSKISMLIKHKEIITIQNGYDLKYAAEASDVKQYTDLFTIAFAGTIYEWHPWRIALQCLNDFAEQNEISLRLNIYGVNIQKQIEEYLNSNCSKSLMVNFYPKMPNNLLLQELAKANVLLLFNDYSILGTKIFDYLAVCRKILLCFSEDPLALELKKKYFCISEFAQHSNKLQEELILETDSGIIVKNESHLHEVLMKITREFNEYKKISCNSKGIEAYSRRNQANKLAELIKSIQNER